MNTYFIQYKNEQTDRYTPELLDDHIKHLAKLHNNKQLITCGPIEAKGEAILLIRAKNMDEIKVIIKSDPFINCGYYEAYHIEQYTEATPDNNWLK